MRPVFRSGGVRRRRAAFIIAREPDRNLRVLPRAKVAAHIKRSYSSKYYAGLPENFQEIDEDTDSQLVEFLDFAGCASAAAGSSQGISPFRGSSSKVLQEPVGLDSEYGTGPAPKWAACRFRTPSMSFRPDEVFSVRSPNRFVEYGCCLHEILSARGSSWRNPGTRRVVGRIPPGG